MPYIRAIYQRNPAIRKALTVYKTDIRKVLAEKFGYTIEEVAFIAEPLSDEAEYFSENILPLEFCVDIGVRPAEGVGDTDSDTLTEMLLAQCPKLKEIHFGVWIRQFSSNGFTEHKP